MTLHESAEQAWGDGRIGYARRLYEQIIESDPDDWGANFQIAWLDGIFGRLTRSRIDGLERPGLSDSAHDRLETLRGMITYPTPIEGGEDSWDIEALRARDGSQEYSSWWEAHGKAAAKAGLFGVALACLEAAEHREPNGAYWDPPSWTHSLPAQLGAHLTLVRSPFA
ncbi:MAG: hypothetical protein ABIS84_03245 [Arachnia sp.]